MTTQLRLLLAVALMGCGIPVLKAQSLPRTQRLYCQLEYKIEYISSEGFHKLARPKKLATGTCFVTAWEGRKYILTAAHNMGIGKDAIPSQVDGFEIGNGSTLISIKSRPVLGLLGYGVLEVGIPAKQMDDWVALRADDAVMASSQVMELADTLPSVGDRVTVLGHPSTAHTKSLNTSVAAIGPKGAHIILNDPVEQGYSGGIVLNRQGKVVGVMMTSTEKQSKAVPVMKESLATLEWKPYDAFKERQFPEAQ